MKPLVIYHANCADGFAACFAAWLKLGDKAEYLPCSYGENSFVDMLEKCDCKIEGREIYILDFSFKKPDMLNLFAGTKRVVWLDHHASAFKEHGLTPNAPGEPAVEPLTKHHVVLDNNKSGAYLAWEYFHPDTEVPMLIQHISDYDLWRFKLEGTKAFNKALWSYSPWSFEQWNGNFLGFDDSVEYHVPYNNFIEQGEAILRAHDQNVRSVVKGSTRGCKIEVNIKGEELRDALEFFSINPDPKLPGLAANCPPHLTSDVGHELANQSGTFGLCWALSKTGLTAKCSLRSNGDYDVSSIAESFGGGGHRNAAGFEVDIQTLLGWLK